MKTNITLFTSPKTAGASLVSLNAALLSPSPKTAWIEIGGWSSQRQNFPALSEHHWGEILAFYKTKEWNNALLTRSKATLGVDFFWSPLGQDYPSFDTKQATAWLDLLSAEYDHLVVDVSAAAPKQWQAFWHGIATKIVGVLTPDPVSLKAWKDWNQTHQYKKVYWLLNQVPPRQIKKVTTEFAADPQFLGALPLDPKRAWDQCYLGFPIVGHKRSKFKTQLQPLINSMIL